MEDGGAPVAEVERRVRETGGVAARLLSVEDDVRIRTSLRMALEEEGYAVTDVATAEEGLSRFVDTAFDVVLVDVLLPGVSGLELCRQLRSRSDVPIIVVTARSDSHDVVAGLEAGADDYVVKPVVVKELAARIRSLLRRVQRLASAPERYVFGDLEIAPEAGTVTHHGTPVALTKTEFRLLVDLVEHAGAILSRDQLLERIWGYEFLGDGRLVDSHIRRLRTKIEPDPANPVRVITVRGLGYKFDPA